MGWQCPNCLVVYAPSVEKCECSVLPKQYSGFGPATTVTGTGTTVYNGYISDSPKLYTLNVEIVNGNIQLVRN